MTDTTDPCVAAAKAYGAWADAFLAANAARHAAREAARDVAYIEAIA